MHGHPSVSVLLKHLSPLSPDLLVSYRENTSKQVKEETTHRNYEPKPG